MLATWFLLSLVPPPSSAPAAPLLRAQEDEPAAANVVLIRAERVIVRPGEERENVSILVRDGRIVALGADLAAPEGARELSGAVVCAGFLDPWSGLGVDGGSVRDQGTSFATRAVDGLDTYSDDYERTETLRAGVTAARIQAGLSSRASGLGAVVRNHPGLEGQDAVVLPDACVGATVAVDRGGNESDVFDRIGELDKLVGAIESGRKYREDWIEYRYDLEEWQKTIAEKEEELEKDFKKAKKDREKDIEKAEEKDKEYKEKRYKEDRPPRKPKYDENDEVMARVANGELPLVVEIDRAPELRGLLEKTAELDRLRLVISGGDETEAFAAELARRRIPVILSPAPKREPGETLDSGLVGTNLGLAARLAEAGVEVLFGSGTPDPLASRDLPTMVSLAIAHGLDREAAFSALTLGAAEALDVADRLGSVQVGKDADLLVLDGPPLATSTRVQYVISGGEIVVEP